MTTRDYRKTSNQIAADLLRFFDQDPDVIDLLVFKAVKDSEETLTTNPDVVGSLENTDRAIEYADPIASKGKILPFNWRSMTLDDGTGPNDGDSDEPIQMLIKETDIPKQSVIQWDEYISNTETRTVTMYLLSSEEMGQAPAITTLYFLIPFGDDDSAFKD